MFKIFGTLLLAFGLAGAANALQTLHPHPHPPGDHPGPSAPAAPEIDPASAIAALTLLGGAIAVVRGRRLKK